MPQAPEQAAGKAQKLLQRRWYRVNRPAGQASMAADKGLAREFGSLLFHWSFFLVMIGTVIGKGTGFTGFAAITEGECWVEAAANYDGNLRTGRYFGGDHTGAEICVDSFSDTYRTSGVPMDFVTQARLTSGDGATTTTHDIRLNDPGSVDGLHLYQFAFGWAPEIEVRRGDRVIADGPIQFERNPVPDGASELAVPWHGALRLPTAEPQRGVQFDLWPSSEAFGQFLATKQASVMMTSAEQPVLIFDVYEGDLAAELQPRFSEIDARGLRRTAQGLVGEGGTVSLETGRSLDGDRLERARASGELTMSFTGIRQYTVLQVSRDRGLWIMLAAAILILVGLIPRPLHGASQGVGARRARRTRERSQGGGVRLATDDAVRRGVRPAGSRSGASDRRRGPPGPQRSETERVGAR